MRDQFAIGRCLLGIRRNRQRQGGIDQIQRICIPTVNERVIHAQRAVPHRVVLHREHAGKVSRAVRKQIHASLDLPGDRDRKARSAIDSTQIADQRRRRVCFRQIEVDRAAFKRRHDRSIRKSQASAEYRFVQQIHFAAGCDVHIVHAGQFRHYHHVVRIKRHRCRLAEAFHKDCTVAYRMDILCQAAAAHDQPATVHKSRLARQAAVRYHLATYRTDLRPARNSPARYIHRSPGYLCIKSQTPLRHNNGTQPSPNPIGSGPIPWPPFPLQQNSRRSTTTRNKQCPIINCHILCKTTVRNIKRSIGHERLFCYTSAGNSQISI